MTVTLSRLRSFIALAETKSFEKTADLVGRSQPAVTEQIRTLEETLGVALFHRQTRAVSLTPEGELLFDRLKVILQDLDHLMEDVARVASLEVGQVRVGATPTLAGQILAEIIGSFRKKHPGIRVEFIDEPAARLEQLVQDQAIDFYFGPKPSLRSGLRFQVIATDPFVAIVPKGHPLARAGCTSVRQLTEYPMLLMSKGTNVREQVDQFIQRHRLKPQLVEEVTNHFTLGGLVQAGCGITLLPRSAHPVMAHPATVAVAIPDDAFVRVLGIAMRADYHASPAANAFLTEMVPGIKKLLNRADRVDAPLTVK